MEEKMRVYICAEMEEHEKTYRLPFSIEVGEVMQHWLRDVGETEGLWIFRKVNGLYLEGGEKLMDIGETEVGSKLVVLSVEKTETSDGDNVAINVSVFGNSSEDVLPIDVKLSQKPDEAHEVIRDRLQLPDERHFRLRTGDAVLQYNATFREQSVCANSTVFVEFGYDVEVKDVWSKGVEKHLVFSSDFLRDVLSIDDGEDRRLRLGRHCLDLAKNLVSSLPAHAVQLMRFRVHLESRRSVAVHLGRDFKHGLVWPYDRLSKIVRKLSPSSRLEYDGEPVHLENSFKDMGLEADGLICECRSVAVKFSSGLRKAVWVPKLSTVSDLKEEIMKTEHDGDFALKCGRRVLQPDDAVDDESVTGKIVEVERFENSFVVSLPDRSVRWTSRKGPMRFTQFGYELLRKGEMEWGDVAELEFSCDGCGRRICRSREQHQVVPVECCQVRSLRLTSLSPVDMKDADTQGVPKVDDCSTGGVSIPMKTTTAGRRCPMRSGRGRSVRKRHVTHLEGDSLLEDQSCQTVVDRESETTRNWRELGAETASTQQSPPEPWPSNAGTPTGLFPEKQDDSPVPLRRPTAQKVHINANMTKTVLFDPSSTVHDACANIRDEVQEAMRSFGLFIRADDPQKGLWLEPERTLDHYAFHNEDTIEYKLKERRLCIRTMDGTRKTMQVDDSKTVGELMVPICTKMGIVNHEEYSLVRELEEAEKERTSALGRHHSFRKDQGKMRTYDDFNWLVHSSTLRQQGIREEEVLLLRRKYFFDQDADERDPVQLSLLYVQLKDDILNGVHPITQDEAIKLAGFQCQVEMGNFKERHHKVGTLDLGKYLPVEYVKVWGIGRKIFDHHKACKGLQDSDAKVEYCRLCRSLKTFGTTFFLVKERLKDQPRLVSILLGISKDSIVRMNEKTKKILNTWSLTMVKRWAASPNTFTFDFGDYADNYYTVQTTEGERIAETVSDYVDMILKRQSGLSSHL